MPVKDQLYSAQRSLHREERVGKVEHSVIEVENDTSERNLRNKDVRKELHPSEVFAALL